MGLVQYGSWNRAYIWKKERDRDSTVKWELFNVCLCYYAFNNILGTTKKCHIPLHHSPDAILIILIWKVNPRLEPSM
jgi:hypothetical protein